MKLLLLVISVVSVALAVFGEASNRLYWLIITAWSSLSYQIKDWDY